MCLFLCGFPFFFLYFVPLLTKSCFSVEKLISTSERHAEHPFASWNTQHTTVSFFPDWQQHQLYLIKLKKIEGALTWSICSTNVVKTLSEPELEFRFKFELFRIELELIPSVKLTWTCKQAKNNQQLDSRP